MSWYKQPIRPIDPVIEYDQPQPTIRYIRSEFGGAGQYSQVQDTAQPQDQFNQLLNVMPPVRGVFYKRRGYYPYIPALGYTPEHLDVYADEAANPPTRKIITLGTSTVGAFQENGNPYNPAIYHPTGGVAPLMAYSRSTAYFFDDLTPSQKWNGSASGGVSLTGIDITNSTGTTSMSNITTSPTPEGTFIDGGGIYPWSTTGPASWSGNFHVGNRITTDNLLCQTYGFALGAGASVNWVQASLTFNYVDSSGGVLDDTLYVQMLKGGVPYGPVQSMPLTIGSGQTFVATWYMGSGLSLNDADVNDPTFGIQVYAFLDWMNPDSDLSNWVKTLGIPASDAVLTVNYDATATSNQITIASVATAGNITLTNGRTYYCVFRNSMTAHMSDLSMPSASTGAITNKEVSLSGIPQSLDPQVDVKWLLATADGGDETLLYFLVELPNATGTYVDNTDELSLLANNIVQETDVNGNDIGVADNAPPPLGTLPVKHQGRLFIAHNATLYCSKNLQELTTSTGLITGRYEEAWPTQNQFDITDDAETVRALISDGTTLYLCTNRHIRRLTGDSPADFQLTSIAFNEAGVAVHDAIDVIYAAGSPAGAAWLTPDNRVIESDFNTYADIGMPIQDVLNSNLNPSGTKVVFFSDGPYDLLTVQINTASTSGPNNVWCVYDLRDRTWVIWNLFDSTNPALFLVSQAGTPIWLFTDNSHNIYRLAEGLTSDNGTPFSARVQTGYLHLGSPSSRKYLNEIEVMTGVPELRVTIEAANLTSDFTANNYIVFNQPLVVSPLGPYKVFLSHLPTHHRYYRFQFSTNSDTTSPILESFNIEAVPIHLI